MKFFRKNFDDWSMLDTSVENIFINEYMVSAPGDYVKVYIYALMYSDLNMEMGNDVIAKQLDMTIEEVLLAWAYWDEAGAVKRHYKGESRLVYDVEFLSLKAIMHGCRNWSNNSEPPEQEQSNASPKAKDFPEGGNPLGDRELKELYNAIEHILGRPLNGTEIHAISDWFDDYRVTPEVILYAYTYSKERGKDNYRYVGTVVKNWSREGLVTAEAVEAKLAKNDERNSLYRRVLKALGFMRNPTEEEARKMDDWFDAMGFSMDRILEACSKTSGISNPNINYVNKILKDWYEEGRKYGTDVPGIGTQISANDVFRYYDFLRTNAETDAELRQKELYNKVPELKKLDEQIRRYSIEASKLLVSQDRDKQSKIHDLNHKIETVTVEKAALMTDNNFPPDYAEVRYKCEKCKDRGIMESGQRCDCFAQRTMEAESWIKRN